MIHEDQRRKLIDWGGGKIWKSAKVVIAKEDCILGNHYHKKKHERFMLVAGEGTIILRDKIEEEIEIGKIYDIEPNAKHAFQLKKGSILLGLGTTEFDPEDEYRS